MVPLLVSLFQSRVDPGLTVDRVFAQIQSDWGGLLAEEFASVVPETEEQTRGSAKAIEAIGFRFDNTRVVVAAFGIPYDFDVQTAAEVSAYWEDGLELPDIHGPSLVVTVLPNVDAGDDPDEYYLDDDRDVIGEAILISRVAASVQACTDSLTAVFAHTADMLIPPATYRSVALDAAPGLPMTTWVDFLVADEAGTTSGETIGLTDLRLCDVEIPDSQMPAETVVRVLVDAAMFQYEHGLVVEDGMTLESEFGEFQANIVPSKYDPEFWVMQLTPPVLANRAQRRAAARKRRR